MPSSRRPGQRYPSDETPEFRAYRTQWQRQANAKLRRLVIEGYGGQCVHCGTLEKLELDHVNGGGQAERKAHGGSLWKYRAAIRERFPSRYQVLCAPCNKKKGDYWQ